MHCTYRVTDTYTSKIPREGASHWISVKFSLSVDTIMERLGFDGGSDVELGGERNRRDHGTVTTTTTTTIGDIGIILLILGTFIGLCGAAQPEVSRVVVGTVWNTSRSNIGVMSTSHRLFFIPVVKEEKDLIPVSKKPFASLRIRRSPEDDINKPLVKKKRLVPLIIWFIQHIGGDDSRETQKILDREEEAVVELENDVEGSTEEEGRIRRKRHSQVGDGTIKVSGIILEPMNFTYYPAVW